VWVLCPGSQDNRLLAGKPTVHLFKGAPSEQHVFARSEGTELGDITWQMPWDAISSPNQAATVHGGDQTYFHCGRVKGTNLTNINERVDILSPWLVAIDRFWVRPGWPSGSMMRPSYFSGCCKGGGIIGQAAVTMIASKGDSSSHPW